jgi:hypothetical protein
MAQPSTLACFRIVKACIFWNVVETHCLKKWLKLRENLWDFQNFNDVRKFKSKVIYFFKWTFKWLKVILAIWFPTMQMAINHSIGNVIYVTHPCFVDIAPLYFNMFQDFSNNLKMTQCEIRLILKTLIQRF